MAAPITTRSTKAPTRAAGLRTSFRHTRPRSAPRRVASGTATEGGASVPMDTAPSAHPDLRVQVDVEHVDREVHEDDDEGEKEDPRLDDGEVELADGAHDEATHPGHREHRLGNDGPGQKQTELEPRHGDQRQGRVDEGMVADDEPLRH